MGIGLIDGVTGIVRKPVEGIVLRKKRNEKENPTSTSPAGALYGGAAGFAKGVVQGRLFVWYYFLGFTFFFCFFFVGVVGVAVKPVAGVMDLATKTTGMVAVWSIHS